MSRVQEIGGIEKHKAQQLTVTKTSGAGTRHIHCIYTQGSNEILVYAFFKNVYTLRIIFGMCIDMVQQGAYISSRKVRREHVIL